MYSNKSPGVLEPGTFIYSWTVFIPSMVWSTWLNMLLAEMTWVNQMNKVLQTIPFKRAQTQGHLVLRLLYKVDLEVSTEQLSNLINY